MLIIIPRKAYEIIRLLPPDEMNGKNDEKYGVTPNPAHILAMAFTVSAIMHPLPITIPNWFFALDEMTNPDTITKATTVITANTMTSPHVANI